MLQAALVAAKEEISRLEDVCWQVKCGDRQSFKLGKLITQDDFLNHGFDKVCPIFNDYKRLFLVNTGDYFSLSQAYCAARVFNPLLVAATMTIADIEMAVKALRHFNFDEFRIGNGIIEDMIKQIPVYMAPVKSTVQSYWNDVEGAKSMIKDRANKVTKHPEKYNVNYMWKKDPIEKSRRIWEWWRANHIVLSINYFVLAVRLVVLVQISSASVERIFSQVKLICDAIGVSGLEETIVACMYERCNDYSIFSQS